MRGIVEELSKEVSKRGDEYLRVQIDGEKYSIWDTVYFDQLHEGDSIEFAYKESGQWKNITELTVTDDARIGHQKPTEEYRSLRDRQIARMSCVKSAAHVLANIDIEAEKKGEQTLGLARVFELYVYEDDL